LEQFRAALGVSDCAEPDEPEVAVDDGCSTVLVAPPCWPGATPTEPDEARESIDGTALDELVAQPATTITAKPAVAVATSLSNLISLL